MYGYGCTLARVYIGTGVLNTLFKGCTLVRWYVGTLVRVYIGTGTGTGTGAGTCTGTGVRSNTLSPYFKGLNLSQHLKPLF